MLVSVVVTGVSGSPLPSTESMALFKAWPVILCHVFATLGYPQLRHFASFSNAANALSVGLSRQ